MWTMKLIYVAGKYLDDYENPTREGTDANIAIAEEHSIELIRKGWAVITPHKNTAGYEKYEDGKTIAWQTWLDMDFEIIRRCDAIYMLPNWEISKGARMELALAQELGLEIYGHKFKDAPAMPRHG